MVGAALLTWTAWFNGFPLLYHDSVLYIDLGKPLGAAMLSPHGHPVLEPRAEFYALLLYVLDRGRTLWPVVWFNALLTSTVLWLLMRRFVVRWRPAAFLAVVAVLGFLSGLSWVVDWILTDVYGALAYLCLWLLVFAYEEYCGWERWLLAVIAWWGVCAHSSHMLLAGLVCVLCAVICLLPWSGARARLERVGVAVGIIVVSALSLMAIHGYLNGKPSITGYRPPYLMARVIGDGPGRWYLQAHCPQMNWAVCTRVNSLPQSSQDFLWGKGNLWLDASPEVKQRLRAEEMPLVIAAVRAYPLAELHHAFWNARAQFSTFYFDDFVSDPSLVADFRAAMPAAAVAFERSRQAHNELPIEAAAGVQRWLIVISCVWLGACAALPVRRRLLKTALLAAVVVPVVVANAIVCGVLSQPDARLQLRVIWMIPLLALLAAIEVLPVFGAAE